MTNQQRKELAKLKWYPIFKSLMIKHFGWRNTEADDEIAAFFCNELHQAEAAAVEAAFEKLWNNLVEKYWKTSELAHPVIEMVNIKLEADQTLRELYPKDKEGK